MSTTIERAVGRLFPALALRYRAYRGLIANEESYLHLSGWVRSLQENKPVDAHGNPVPWMNFSLIELLDRSLSRDLTLFEFGSGYSTIFFTNRVKHVTSVETDKLWFDYITSTAGANLNVKLGRVDIDGAYCRLVRSPDTTYDVIVVDGRDRVNCMKQSLHALSDRGVIVLDDSQRSRYREGIRYLEENGFGHLHIGGLSPTEFDVDRATIFYRAGNCLGI